MGVHHARIDWLAQRPRGDCHAVAAMRDGRVPWQALMVPMRAWLEGAADETEAERSPTGETPISTRVPVEGCPMDVLPKPLARLVREASMALPYPT